ncbi:hypothetical protein SAMN05421510_103926 [Nitrosomonas ureae]|uniref:Transposase n=1 Tax=Nitrosomonas ureae TaxID=44577 RepID=A0A0S3ALA8_9PROT|nr:hypothetical protein ATY38_12395 [Nitrosomonas ureae]SDU27929.1 hypothetical protein SAMN05216406_1433 [Nitrosomonas ureae]SEQ34024.1 hypothetical protein SAMN05421510_103926 [Nitrosomonas ureae]
MIFLPVKQQLLGENRNTINRWYGIFRKGIYNRQTALKDKLLGKAEVDESYFRAIQHRGCHEAMTQ